jgi:hypothetical protein
MSRAGYRRSCVTLLYLSSCRSVNQASGGCVSLWERWDQRVKYAVSISAATKITNDTIRSRRGTSCHAFPTLSVKVVREVRFRDS